MTEKPRFANARRLVEHLSLIEAMRCTIICGVKDPNSDNAKLLIKCIEEAMDEAMPVGTVKEHKAIVRRVNDLVRNVIAAPFVEEKQPASKLGLSVYYLMSNLLQQGLYWVPKGTKQELAIETVLGSLEDFTTAEFRAFDKSAFKSARRMLTRLQAAGYFGTALWVEKFVELEASA